MTYLIVKAVLSGIIVMIVSEVGLRNPSISGLIASLPLISILAFIWLWRDTSDAARIAAQSEATFWYIFPSIPMFLALPAMLRNGVGFWAALSISCVITLVLYSATMWVLPRIGINVYLGLVASCSRAMRRDDSGEYRESAGATKGSDPK